jgi:hypothetical protein
VLHLQGAAGVEYAKENVILQASDLQGGGVPSRGLEPREKVWIVGVAASGRITRVYPLGAAVKDKMGLCTGNDFAGAT